MFWRGFFDWHVLLIGVWGAGLYGLNGAGWAKIQSWPWGVFWVVLGFSLWTPYPYRWVWLLYPLGGIIAIRRRSAKRSVGGLR
ncbi:MAG: hypothetical protein C7B45_11445 [Sulfobacillus acidophilus]|uniref:Uncharacterized protein n=1 Tax=Sulfobacillus acidophilus TaxID=53633 RepID=A0A2T2WGH4_9FIRM|nr:MAG: hypothetical protein C7B45_11445 [Sulfobacillus acidophilus]